MGNSFRKGKRVRDRPGSSGLDGAQASRAKTLGSRGGRKNGSETVSFPARPGPHKLRLVNFYENQFYLIKFDLTILFKIINNISMDRNWRF
jgi:hypothetical protein